MEAVKALWGDSRRNMWLASIAAQTLATDKSPVLQMAMAAAMGVLFLSPRSPIQRMRLDRKWTQYVWIAFGLALPAWAAETNIEKKLFNEVKVPIAGPIAAAALVGLVTQSKYGRFPAGSVVFTPAPAPL